jgi:hypothetical protein
VTATETVFEAVREVVCGQALTFKNLTVLPLIAQCERNADYAVLDEALARGWLEITETSEQGRVPELRVVNHSDTGVLLVDGEELLGAKQNRVLNLSMLIPAHHSHVIPVSCVEAGRWHHVSSRFSSTPRTQFAEGRAAKMQQVTSSLRESGRRSSDQHAVWHAIAQKSSRLGAHSDTAAMSAMYESMDDSLGDFVAAFPPLERQAGAVFFVNGRLAGLELFDAPGTWRKLAAKLVRSYALDAIDRRHELSRRVTTPGTGPLVDAIIACRPTVVPAIGEGEDVRLSGSGIAGAALVARDRAIHVSVLSAPGA